MENLVKQMRVRFSGVGDGRQEVPSSGRERKLPPQKTQSFKGGKKTQNWPSRQVSGEMSQDIDSNGNIEFATAIAAAAAAIHSIEEENAPRKLSDGTEIPLTKSMSRKDDISVGRVSKHFSTKESNADKQTPGESSMKKSEVADQRKPEGWTDQKIPKKAQSIKKTPTFGENKQNDNGSTKFPTEYDAFPAPRRGETKADIWERTEMTKINKRHERMTSTILSWEKGKKDKAKRRMDRIESEIERRRARALQQYRNDMSRIDQIAGGARAVAEDKRRDEVTKTKVKANKIRSTGRVPVTCFCF